MQIKKSEAATAGTVTTPRKENITLNDVITKRLEAQDVPRILEEMAAKSRELNAAGIKTLSVSIHAGTLLRPRILVSDAGAEYLRARGAVLFPCEAMDELLLNCGDFDVLTLLPEKEPLWGTVQEIDEEDDADG